MNISVVLTTADRHDHFRGRQLLQQFDSKYKDDKNSEELIDMLMACPKQPK